MSDAVTLVGDVGGTNTRLALARGGRLEAPRDYTNARTGSLEAAITQYLEEQSAARPAGLVLAVAAPVCAGSATLTNLHWHIDAASLQRRLGFQQVALLNDFAALAYALPALDAADLMALGNGAAVPAAPRLVLGPGTGLGAALWVPPGQVVATEAGHALLAAATPAQAELLRLLGAPGTPVSREYVLCGAGLGRLYRALGGRSQEEPTGSAFSALWQAGDPAAQAALAAFFEFLGVVARDLALGCGARGGVYLAGGILPQYADALRASEFRQRFELAAPLPGYLEAIPTCLIRHPHPALLGAARLAAGSASPAYDA